MRKKLVILPKLNDSNGNSHEPWFVYYSYRDPQTGKMKRFKIQRGLNDGTKEERYQVAEELIQEYRKKLKGGWSPFDNDDEEVIYDDEIQYANVAKVYGQKRQSNKTFDVYFSAFLKETKKRVSPKSFESYQSKIRLFSQFLHRKNFDCNDISTISSEVIKEFFDYLIEERKLQGRTIQKYGVNLRQLFKFLEDNKIMYYNPMIEVPKVPNKLDYSASPIRENDVSLLKNYIKKHDPQLWLAIEFEFYCFIRPGNELRHMKIDWIDFYNGTVTVPAYMEIDGELAQIAKNKKKEIVVIPKQFLDEIIGVYHLDKFEKDLYVFGRNRMPGEQCMGKNTMRTRFNKYRDVLGLSKDYKFYSWKHTGGINAHRAGVPIKDISTQMRHHDLSITDAYFKKMLPTESEHLKNRFPTL